IERKNGSDKTSLSGPRSTARRSSAVCWQMRRVARRSAWLTCAKPARSHLHGAMESNVATVGGLWCGTLQIDQNETVPVVTSRVRAHEHVRVVLKIQRQSCL